MRLLGLFLVGCLAIILVYGDGVAKPPPPRPQITIYRASPLKFPIPYGYGLRIEYSIDLKLDEAPWRKAESVTTQYSPDGQTWYTDEAARSPSYRWDNIHGDIVCGPTRYNLRSGHTYTLRVILNWRDASSRLHLTYSNQVLATVEDYSELYIEETIAEKFKPVVHRHPDELQPEGLVDVDKVLWASRRVYNILGQQYPGNRISKYSAFHWRYGYQWDSWGNGQGSAHYRWDLDDAERHREEIPGERPLYYHVYSKGSYYYVQYWCFMTMNDTRDQTNECTWHEGDFEHVAIEVERAGDRFVPRRVNFYKHEGGRQFPASECWWGSYATGHAMELPPQQGYDEAHTHLHVWIARNAHASYNLGEPLYEINAAGDVYTDDVDYDPDPWTGLYNTFFTYDYLVNMGEIKRSPDTDGDGYINAHGWEWFDHWDHVSAWRDLQWLPFRGRLGTYWCKKPDGTIATWVLLFKNICTPSPKSPAWSGLDWTTFSDNVDCGGFGNRDRTGVDFKWRNPYTGEVVCNP